AGGGRLDADELESVARAVSETGEVDRKTLRELTDLSASKISKATAELEDQGLLRQTATGIATMTSDDVDIERAAEVMLENQDRHRAQLMRSLERMRTYAELRDCRRRYLLDYFGQEIEPCGRCDNCERGLPESQGDADERPFPVRTRVVHQKL